MGGMYDAEEIRANHRVSDVVGHYVSLKRKGQEFVGLSPFNKEKTPSFTVNDDKQFYHCFSSGKHGDVIQFIIEICGVNFRQACELLGADLKDAPNAIAPRAKPEERIFTPAPIPADFVPFEAGVPILGWQLRGERQTSMVADYVWPYHTVDGDLIGYILRVDFHDRKEYFPLRHVMIDGKPRWVWAGFDRPRPLYQAHLIEPVGPVLIVEGEKDADAATRMTGRPVTTWPGGTNAVSHVDFSPLQGRDVILWLDADEPGEKATGAASRLLLKMGAKSIKAVPWDHDRDKGWGAADAEDLGWSGDEVDELLDTAVEYGPFDESSPEPPLEGEVLEPARALFSTSFQWQDPATLPKRQWLYGRHLIRRFVSVTIAPGGLGKSSLVLAEALCMASGKSLLGDYVAAPLRVGYWNGEDPESENRYRITAAACHHGIKPEDFAHNLFLDTGREQKIIVAIQTRDGTTINAPDVGKLERAIIENKLDVVIIDPFISAHSVSENDNGAIQVVVQALVDITERTGCAMELVHHIRKPGSGITTETTVDDARGATALIGKARSARVLNVMTQEEADRLEITNRFRYFRVDNGKANLAPRSDKAEWRHIASFDLGNADENGETDEIAVVEKWEMPTNISMIPMDGARVAQRLVVHSEYRADPQSSDWLGHALAAEFGMNPTDKKHVSQLKKYVEALVSNRAVLIEMRKDKQRKLKPFLIMGDPLDD